MSAPVHQAKDSLNLDSEAFDEGEIFLVQSSPLNSLANVNGD